MADPSAGRRAELLAMERPALVALVLDLEARLARPSKKRGAPEAPGSASSPPPAGPKRARVAVAAAAAAAGGGRGAEAEAKDAWLAELEARRAAGGTLSKRERKALRKRDGARGFDMARHRLRHVALKVAYRGEPYFGFAAQPDVKETVEEKLFEALEKTCLVQARDRCNWSRCGRTDRGVSALGQVVAGFFRSRAPDGAEGLVPPAQAERVLRGDGAAGGGGPAAGAAAASPPPSEAEMRERAKIAHHVWRAAVKERRPKGEPGAGARPDVAAAADDGELDYVAILNRVLPEDIRVLAWSPVPLGFSARFSCEYRRYKYYFFADDMDVNRMAEAARLLCGEHDYRNFCKIDVVNVGHFRRSIGAFEVRRADDQYGRVRARPDLHGDAAAAGPAPARQHPDCLYEFEITGTAFLWHQVRNMVAVLFAVGRGDEAPSVVSEMLDVERNPRKPAYEMASDAPLVLHECGFPNVRWRATADVARRAFADLHLNWRRRTVQCRVLESFWTEARRVALGEEGDTAAPAASAAPGGNLAALDRVWDLRGQQLARRGRRGRPVHVPLLKRKGGATVDEKVAALTGKRKNRRDRREEQTALVSEAAAEAGAGD